ncbi:CBN-ZFP-2 protein [Caenorhabditis brenneri]|uniref:CBN-ZFP-2 protein n=1 Tax=Caenorhabditis brenneri TaxID=135651 RepID=G0MN21_CAEBE|nr:CBN-ZFP-2 protein [Caenorhabditis brenneri]
MEEIMIPDDSIVLYEEEVTAAHELPVQWGGEKPIGYELTDTKCYKTPSGVQKTATLQREHVVSEPQPIIEQIVEMDGEYDMEGFDMHSAPCTSSSSQGSLPNDPSTSTATTSYQPEPLRRMAIQIGKRILRFKVINATDAPEAPLDTSDAWIQDPRPVTTPKALAGLYHCAQCKTYFGNKEVYQRHVMATAHQPQQFDTGPPPDDLLPNGKTARYNCSYCNLRFHFRKDKEIHERVHTGEKPYECGYCMKAFAQSQALTAHIRTHTKEMPYSCGKCSKRFRDNSCLRKHELAAHTDAPIVRSVAVEYVDRLEKQNQVQREQRRNKELLTGERNPNFRL